MKTIVVKLEVILDIVELPVAASINQDPIPDLMRSLKEDVDQIAEKCGLVKSVYADDHPSRRNGGWAFYTPYFYEAENKLLKIVIEIRTADHPSKPSLAKKNENREDAFRKGKLPKILDENSHEDEVGLEFVDTYYQEREWGVQYYIGKGSQYSQPANSLDEFNVMLVGKFKKLIAKYF